MISRPRLWSEQQIVVEWKKKMMLVLILMASPIGVPQGVVVVQQHVGDEAAADVERTHGVDHEDGQDEVQQRQQRCY